MLPRATKNAPGTPHVTRGPLIAHPWRSGSLQLQDTEHHSLMHFKDMPFRTVDKIFWTYALYRSVVEQTKYFLRIILLQLNVIHVS